MIRAQKLTLLMKHLISFVNVSLSNSNYFMSAKTCRLEKCVIDLTSAKMEFASAKCIFPNIQLKDVVNRLPPFKNLYDHTNSFLTGS